MKKEEIFDMIDEYMSLKNKFYVVRITDKRPAKVFGLMIDAGESFSGHKKEEYSINGLTKRILDKNKIKYKVISKTS